MVRTLRKCKCFNAMGRICKAQFYSQNNMKKTRTRYVFYMTVTPDKYELPLCSPLTVEEIARKYKISANTLFHSVSQNKSGERSGRKFVRVELREE